jgi:hypothetical protein
VNHDVHEEHEGRASDFVCFVFFVVDVLLYRQIGVFASPAVHATYVLTSNMSETTI